MPRRKHNPSAIVTVVAALLLLAAPLARALPAACDRCPADCPMHGKGHLPCHQAPADPAPPHESSGPPCAPTGSAVSAPGCGHIHELPSTTIAPATLPVLTVLAFRAVERRAPASP